SWPLHAVPLLLVCWMPFYSPMIIILTILAMLDEICLEIWRAYLRQRRALRRGRSVIGFAAWGSVDLQTHGGALRVTATPAQHGPADSDRGPVIGFILASVHIPEEGIYISGDTVWFEGVAEVARRFEIHTVVLFMGAARVPAVGSHHLTMTATEGT